MKSEQEIKDALEYTEYLIKSKYFGTFDNTAMMHSILVLRWVLSKNILVDIDGLSKVFGGNLYQEIGDKEQ